MVRSQPPWRTRSAGLMPRKSRRHARGCCEFFEQHFRTMCFEEVLEKRGFPHQARALPLRRAPECDKALMPQRSPNLRLASFAPAGIPAHLHHCGKRRASWLATLQLSRGFALGSWAFQGLVAAAMRAGEKPTDFGRGCKSRSPNSQRRLVLKSMSISGRQLADRKGRRSLMLGDACCFALAGHLPSARQQRPLKLPVAGPCRIPGATYVKGSLRRGRVACCVAACHAGPGLEMIISVTCR